MRSGMRTYKGRTQQQQLEFNRRRKEELQKLHPKETLPDNPEDETTEVEVPDITPRTPPSMKDRILSKLSSSSEEKEKTPKPVVDKAQAAKSLKFFQQILPLTLAGMAATYSKQLFKDPYKPCAPSKQEVADILLPLFSMMSRYIEITGEASQNALDIGAALLASLTLGARMLITLQEIKNYEQQRANNGDTTGTDTRGHDNIRGISKQHSGGESNGTVSIDTIGNRAEGYAGGYRQQPVTTSGNANDTNGTNDDRDIEAEAVARLLRKDTIGRRAMGLAPRLLPEDN
jgi:hypothetical protein